MNTKLAAATLAGAPEEEENHEPLSSAMAAVSPVFDEQVRAAGAENQVPALHSSSCLASPSPSQLEAHALSRQ